MTVFELSRLDDGSKKPKDRLRPGLEIRIEFALTGAMDGHIVNISADAPTTLYEMASLVGSPIEPSAEPLTDPWMGRMDGSQLRSLGFQLTVPTLYQAMRQGIL